MLLQNEDMIMCTVSCAKSLFPDLEFSHDVRQFIMLHSCGSDAKTVVAECSNPG